uniref:serine/threonine-protein kinase Nek1-like n=1 Tax=Myxine glutinosa TaxID=7769 RepID=UPI00358EFBDD
MKKRSRDCVSPTMDCFERLRTVGSGSFGRALLVRKRRDGQLYVIKQIDLSQVCGRVRSEALSEARVLSTLRHPHVVSYHGSFQENETLCIVMDYCEGGDLFQRINTQKGIPFSEEQVVHWLAQLCLALKYIHERKILHRDIKSQNIFLNKGMVKLGDFGIARVLNSTTELARTCIGTPYYFSPEICENKPYNHKSDMWALGCVIYELCTLRHAFEAGNMKNLVLKIVRGAYPPVSTSFSPGLRVLIGRFLARSPRLRPSAAQVLQSSLLQACLPKFLSPQDLLQEFGMGLKRPPPAGGHAEPSAKKPTTRTPGSRVTGPAAKYGVPVVKRPIKKAIRNPSVGLREEHKRRLEEQKQSFINQARLEGWRLVLGLGDKAGGVKPKIGVHAANPAACDDPERKHKVVPQIPVSTPQTFYRGDRAQDKADASIRREDEGLGKLTALKGRRSEMLAFRKLRQEALQNKARVEGHIVKQYNADGDDQNRTRAEVPSFGGAQKVGGKCAVAKDKIRERKKWGEAKNVPLSLAVPLADVDEEEEETYLEIEKRKQWVLQPPPTVLQILDYAPLLTQTLGSPPPPPSLTATQKERDEILERVKGESEAQGLGTHKPGLNIKDQLDEVGDLWRAKTPERDKRTIEDFHIVNKQICQDVWRKCVDIQLMSEVICEGKGVLEIDIAPEDVDKWEYVEKTCEVVEKKHSMEIGNQGEVETEEQRKVDAAREVEVAVQGEVEAGVEGGVEEGGQVEREVEEEVEVGGKVQGEVEAAVQGNVEVEAGRGRLNEKGEVEAGDNWKGEVEAGDMGKEDVEVVDQGDVEAGDQGKGVVEAGHQGKGKVEAGDQGKGDVEVGDMGKGDVEAGEHGKWEVEAGEQGKREVEAGEQGKRKVEAGEQGKGEVEAGGRGRLK